MNPKSIVKFEFIGENIEITESKNNSLKGAKGKIIDETKNLFIVKTKKGEIKLIKSQSTFKIKMKNKIFEINGKVLVGRPEERIKKELK